MGDDKAQLRYPVSFSGSGSEFFKIWIVNITLTILTLYIYSAWAKVRTKRYFYRNTVLDGSSFEYHAKPLQILLSRMVAVLLFVAVTVGGAFNPLVPAIATGVLLLIIPWAIWRSTIFNMRMTSYRNVRFGFDGSLWPVYFYQLVLPTVVYAFSAVGFYFWDQNNFSNEFLGIWIVVVILLNLILTAYTHKHLSSYFLNGYRFGKSRFSEELSLSGFFKTYALALLLAVGTLVALVFVMAILYMPDGVGLPDSVESILDSMDTEGAEDPSRDAMLFFFEALLIFYAYLFVVGYYVVALIRSRVRHHVFGQTSLDQRVNFESTVTATRLWWVMVSNVLLIIVTLGLARPFTQVRMARLLARHSTALSVVPLDNFVGKKRQEISAFGDELGDAFDVDMDVGF